MRHPLLLAFLLAGCPGKEDDSGPIDTDTTPLVDADGDGVPLPADCDDTDPYTYPGADELPYDGVDQDCADGDLVDVDGDGYVGVGAGGDDCSDSNPEVHPGAAEVCYDGLDNDCSGDVDTDDCDGDGWDRTEDCDDEDAAVHPGAEDAWYDGVDGNCDLADDFDQDADGYDALGYTDGTDCDDTDPAVNEDADERWNGVDDDCYGGVDQLNSRDTTGSMYGELDAGDYWLGHAITTLPDADGDGVRQVVAGVPLSGKQNGRVYVGPTLDGPTDLATEALATIDGSGGEALGLSVARVENADGDPFLVAGGIASAWVFRASQLVGGAALDTGDAVAELRPDTDAGAVYPWSDGTGAAFVATCSDVYVGYTTQCGVYALDGVTGTVDVAAARFSVTGTGLALGSGAPGDLDGDGVDELVAGANGFSDATIALLVSGDLVTTGGAVSTDGVVSIGGVAGLLRAHGGTDFDGDGYADLLLSEYQATGDAGELSGVVHVIGGPAATAGGNAGDLDYATVQGAEASDAVRAAERAADMDGDGVVDLVVSGPGEATGDVIGEVWWFAGDVVAAGGTLVPARSTPAFYGTSVDDQFGWMVLPEDMDGDGDDDLLLSLLGGNGGVVWYRRE